MVAALPFLTGPDLARLATDADVVRFLRDALVRPGQVELEDHSPRIFSPAPGGEFLMMPEQGASWSGVKVLTVAPDNPSRGRPKIQGVYTLFDSDDLRPVAMLDAVELTLMRTPATTALAITELLAAGTRPAAHALPVAVVGTGPQAERHLRCLAAVAGPIDAVVIGRRPQAAQALADRCSTSSVSVRVGTPDDLRSAAVVICVTSSSTPVIADDQVGDDAVVAAVGSHGADRAELPAELVLRADLVVESREAALRESGNVLQARPAEQWKTSRQQLWNLAELARGAVVRRPGHPAVYSGVGMAWQDLVTATALYDRWHESQPRQGDNDG